MKNGKMRLIAVIVGVSIIGLFGWVNAALLNSPSSPARDQQPTSAQKRTRTDISYTAKPGVTSLQQLKSEADNVLVVSDEKYGDYVDSIEGHKGGADGYYWSFYVNGVMSEVGAGSYIQKGGEKIEWKFQKL